MTNQSTATPSLTMRLLTSPVFWTLVIILMILLPVLACALLSQDDKVESDIKGSDVAAVCDRWFQQDDPAISPQSGSLGKIWMYDTHDRSSLDLTFDYPIAASLDELDTLVCVKKQVFPSSDYYCTNGESAFNVLIQYVVLDWQKDTLRGIQSFWDSPYATCAPAQDKVTMGGSGDIFEIEKWLTNIEQGRIQ